MSPEALPAPPLGGGKKRPCGPMISMAYNLPGGTGRITERTTERTNEFNGLQHTGRVSAGFGRDRADMSDHISRTYSIPGEFYRNEAGDRADERFQWVADYRADEAATKRKKPVHPRIIELPPECRISSCNPVDIRQRRGRLWRADCASLRPTREGGNRRRAGSGGTSAAHNSTP